MWLINVPAAEKSERPRCDGGGDGVTPVMKVVRVVRLAIDMIHDGTCTTGTQHTPAGIFTKNCRTCSKVEE